MFPIHRLSFLLALFPTIFAGSYNDGISLAIGPTCGSFNGSFADVNGGIKPGHYDTIVSFGDSYSKPLKSTRKSDLNKRTFSADTGGNRDGTPPPPPIVIPPDPEAGGRSSNGYMWGKAAFLFFPSCK